MDLEALMRDARAGKFSPVHILIGQERFLIDRAVAALRKVSIGDGGAGFNDDVFHGKSVNARALVQTANTLPMFATARFVLVRDVEDVPVAELDILAAYLLEPSPTTCVVFLGEKIDGRTRFAKAAKQSGALTEVQSLKGGALRSFAMSEAKERGHKLEADAADALGDAIGSDLSALDDALERLSLYVGANKPMQLGDVEACISRVRVETIWSLVDAVSAKNAKVALFSAQSMLADREPPLKILAMIARQLRMIARMRDAMAAGLRGPEAAKEAGAPPFKAQELSESARRFSGPEIVRAFRLLAETDLALKGSKRPAEVVLEEMLIALCRAPLASPSRGAISRA